MQIASFVSQFGNWLTFTALISHLQQQFGSTAPVMYFLAASVPAFFFIRVVGSWVPVARNEAGWTGAQLGLALTSILLAVSLHNYIAILLIVSVQGILKSTGSSLFSVLSRPLYLKTRDRRRWRSCQLLVL